MPKTKKDGLHAVECCGVFLCQAPANTSIRCPECCRWQNVEGSQADKLRGDQECMKHCSTSH